VRLGHRAVDRAPADDPRLAATLIGLGLALRCRFQRTGDTADLDEAIEVSRRAVALTREDHPDLGGHLANLGGTLHIRFERAGALADLDEAIEVDRRATALPTVNSPRLATMLSNLGGSLQARFERRGDLADLNEAVEVISRSIGLVAADHPDRAMYLSNLGTALSARSRYSGSAQDLDQAVEVDRLAVEATPPDHADFSARLSNLGSTLRARFDQSNANSDLEEAVEVGRRAVDLTPADHPDRARRLSNLGLALWARIGHTGTTGDLTEALAALRGGLELDAAPPLERANCSRLLARLAVAIDDWETAEQALHLTIDKLLPLLVSHGLSRQDRQHHLERLQGLGPAAARAALGGSERGWPRSRIENAWLGLEAGRGVLLTQALSVRTDTSELSKIRPDLAADLNRLRVEFARADTGFQPMALPVDGTVEKASRFEAARLEGMRLARRRQVAGDLQRLLSEIRQLPGLGRFAEPPTIERLRAAPGKGTVVALNVADGGCGALMLTSDGVDYLPLNNLTVESARANAETLRLTTQSTDDRPVDTSALWSVLVWMWDNVTAPVLLHLGYDATPTTAAALWPRVYWIPTGPLAGLPVHAAGYHDDPPGNRRTVLDRVVSSYTPTAAMLAASRCVVRDQAGPALVVGINDGPGLSPLPRAEAEAKAIHKLLKATGSPLLGSAARHDRVVSRLATAAWSHFACHAVSVEGDPSRSYLALADQPLFVAELGQLELGHAYLAFLSACTTAAGSSDLPDESIHLASAFQLAGYPHVIATLWPISDYPAHRVASSMYRRVEDGMSPALSVHTTIRELRDRATLRDGPQVWASYLHLGP
jgi:tetratricopeptide (TPR) repeat protein